MHTYVHIVVVFMFCCFFIYLFSLFIIDDYDKVLVWFGLVWLAAGCWCVVFVVCWNFKRKKLSLSLFLDWRLAKFIQRCYGMFVFLAS